MSFELMNPSRIKEKMKRLFLTVKIAAVTAVTALFFFAAAHEAKAALVDWAKHEEWRRKQLEALMAEVKLKGSAPYVVMSFGNYDKNKDGLIDTNESEAIKAVLSQPPANRPKN